VREPLNAGSCDKSLEEERACSCTGHDGAAEAAAAKAAAAAAAAAAGQEGSADDEEKVNCEWADWHEWEACSKSCGKGITRRSREVLHGANTFGAECAGENRQTQNCNDLPCPCAVGEWSDWSSCAGDCDGQSDRAVRTRELVEQRSSNGTGHCTEVLEQEKACTCSPKAASASSVDDQDLDTLTAADLRAQNLDGQVETQAEAPSDGKLRVAGALELTVPDPVSFSSDPNAETAAQAALMKLIGSLHESYTVSVSLMPTPNNKKSVDCWYSLILPEEEANAVNAKLHAVELSDATQLLGVELQKLSVTATATATSLTATVMATNT